MKKMGLQVCLFCLCLVLLFVPGCNSEQSKTTVDAGEVTFTSYPMETDTTLTYWVPFNSQSTSGVSTFAELPFYQEVMKKTGINVEFIHPVQGQEDEQFNLLIASGEYPDIIEREFINFPGGPQKAISDGYIIPLNEVIEKHAPNLKKYLDEHPDVKKQVVTDDGTYYTFPFLRGDPYLMVYQGIIIRQDWLDELGLAMPETIDEWETVLRAFKEQKGAERPLSYVNTNFVTSRAFIGAYNLTRDVYVDNGVVKYGDYEPAYKEFLTTFNRWYQEGLLDSDISLLDGKTVDYNMLNGVSGASIQNVGGGIGKWMTAMKGKEPASYQLKAAPYPVLNKGDRPRFGQYDFEYTPFGSAAISTQCKNIEVAARFLDYGYSEEGHMVFNFGIEGVSYEMIDGYPTYTDLITNNPNGTPMAEILPQYIRPNGGGPYVQDRRYMEQYSPEPYQKEAIETWMDTDAAQTKIPRMSATAEESEEMSAISQDLTTYCDEMFMKFVMGTEPLSNFDAFREKLKELGVERYIELQQTVYDRYMAR